jgi:hypothetical protein
MVLSQSFEYKIKKPLAKSSFITAHNCPSEPSSQYADGP